MITDAEAKQARQAALDTMRQAAGGKGSEALQAYKRKAQARHNAYLQLLAANVDKAICLVYTGKRNARQRTIERGTRDLQAAGLHVAKVYLSNMHMLYVSKDWTFLAKAVWHIKRAKQGKTTFGYESMPLFGFDSIGSQATRLESNASVAVDWTISVLLDWYLIGKSKSQIDTSKAQELAAEYRQAYFYAMQAASKASGKRQAIAARQAAEYKAAYQNALNTAQAARRPGMPTYTNLARQRRQAAIQAAQEQARQEQAAKQARAAVVAEQERQAAWAELARLAKARQDLNT